MASTPTVTAFQAQLAVEADDGRPGRYRAVIAAEWNCPLVPHGGLVTAVAASAMRAELDAAAQRSGRSPWCSPGRSSPARSRST